MIGVDKNLIDCVYIPSSSPVVVFDQEQQQQGVSNGVVLFCGPNAGLMFLCFVIILLLLLLLLLLFCFCYCVVVFFSN